jgi:aminoglycoside phosphotransferase (APT) family kinase protein
MLTVDSVLPLLVDRGLIPASWIIDGELTIRAAARRNRHLTVEGPDGIGLFLKQPDDPAVGGHGTLRREAEFHRFCREEAALAPVARIIPRLIDTLGSDTILVFEWIAGADSLQSRMESPEGREPSVEVARALGRALGTVHRVLGSRDWSRAPRLAGIPRSLPWVMRLHRPWPGMLADASPAHLEMLRILQGQKGFGERIEQLCVGWRPSTVIHGDTRFDNVLIRASPTAEERDAVALWIADWELIQIGDPGWDLAGALQDFLGIWVDSMRLSDELSAEATIAGAGVPLAAVRRAARAMWSGYRQEAGLDPAAADDLLTRAVALSAIRLIQSTFEVTVGAGRLEGRPVLLLQIGANLLAEPERGQIQLYGIPLGETSR